MDNTNCESFPSVFAGTQTNRPSASRWFGVAFNRKQRNLFLAGALLALLNLPARADTVVLQTVFEAPVAPGYYSSGQGVGAPDAVNIRSGAASVITGNWVDSDESTIVLQALKIISNPIQIYSTGNFGPGDYELQVSLAGGSQTAGALVQLGAGNFQSFNVPANSPFTTYTSFETISENTAAPFFLSSYPGILVNSITITELSIAGTPTPEPSSWALLSVAAVCLSTIAAQKNVRTTLLKNSIAHQSDNRE